MTRTSATYGDVPDSRYDESALQTWIALGECSVTLGMILSASQCFEYAMNHDPLNAKALVGLAHSLRMKDLQIKDASGSREALDKLNMALDKYPHVARRGDVFRELAECYLVLGMVDQAHQAVETGIQIDGDHVQLWLLHGQVLNRAGQTKQAVEKLRHCLTLLQHPLTKCTTDQIDVARGTHAELAAIATTEGDIDGSIAELVRALSLPPPPLEMVDEHIALWCALATAKERAHDIGGALRACEDAETIVGNYPRILMTHAYLMLNTPGGTSDSTTEHFAQMAIGLLESIVKLEDDQGQANDDGDFLPWYLMGKAYSRLDAPRAAYDSYQVALRRAPKSPIPWLAIGKLYLQLNQLPDTLAAYSQALRLQVDEKSSATGTAWDGLSCVYERSTGQLMDAADACDRAAKCFNLTGERNIAEFFEIRSRQLQLASNREGPVPPLRDAPDVPTSLLRDLVALLPSERIVFVQGTLTKYSPQQQSQQNRQGSTVKHQMQQAPINGSTQTSQQNPQQPALPQHYQPQQPYKSIHESSPRQNFAPPHHMWSPSQQPHQQRQYSPNIPPPPMVNPNQYPHYFYQQPPSNGLQPGAMPARNQQMLQRSPSNNPQMMSQPMGPNMAPGHPGQPPPPPGYAYGQYLPMQGTMAYPANNWGK